MYPAGPSVYKSISRHQVSPFLAAVACGRESLYASRMLPAWLHQGPTSSPWEMSPYKGDLVESLMNRLILRGFLAESGTWSMGTPARIGRGGIDGLFFKLDGHDRIVDLMVVESKYRYSGLGMTRTGKQMSDSWIRKRLEQSAHRYLNLAGAIEENRVAIVQNPPPDVRLVHIPCRRGGGVYAGFDNKRAFILSDSGEKFNLAEIHAQAKRAADYLHFAADGKVSYRSRLLRYSFVGDEHIITVQELDKQCRSTGQQIIRGRFSNLPPDARRAIRSEYERQFLAMGNSREDASALADKASRNPKFFKEMLRHPTPNLRIGLDKYAAWAAGIGGGLAFAFEAGGQLWRGQKFNLGRCFAMGGVNAVASFTGYYVGAQITSRLIASRIATDLTTALPLRSISGISGAQVVGTVVGAGVAIAIASYGAMIIGYGDIRDANRNALIGGTGFLGGAGFSAATLSVVMAYGTAGTGAAISSLSGAAAMNASLAYLGGGTIAAGGGGMAVGGAVLTGGVAIVGFACALAAGKVFRMLDEKEKRIVLEGRMEILARKYNHVIHDPSGISTESTCI